MRRQATGEAYGLFQSGAFGSGLPPLILWQFSLTNVSHSFPNFMIKKRPPKVPS